MYVVFCRMKSQSVLCEFFQLLMFTIHFCKNVKITCLLLVFFQESDANMMISAMRDSQVLVSKDNMSWDWPLIIAILQWQDDALRRLEDQNHIK